jgi:glucose/arabinose dehydrogenase
VTKKLVLIALFFFVSAFSLRCGGGGGGGDGDSSTTSDTGPEWPGIAFTKVLSGFSQPLGIEHAGDGSGRLFIVEQGGKIWVVRDGSVLEAPFLDISDRITTSHLEQGLLGLAFPPGYENKGYFYVNYSLSTDGSTVVARYRLTGNPDVADPGSEEVILSVEQPFGNHNGGQIVFGPDGYFYIGMGDGGSGGDPLGNAQNTGVILGKMLRIDVESGSSPYSVPSGNPFVSDPGTMDEIWALGLRNPWRFSFDRETGDLYIADVGQHDYEEVNFQSTSSTGGENYGWNIMEGAHCYINSTCEQTGLTLPVAEYSHSGEDEHDDNGDHEHEGGSCSITGGFVYRGDGYPSLEGVYLYGDYCSGNVWGLRKSGPDWETSLLSDTEFLISTFGEDESGELYLADHTGGDIYLVTSE